MKKTMILAAALLFAQMAFAGFYTGNDLKKWADASSRISQGTSFGSDGHFASTLKGFIVGVADAQEGDLICVPTGTTVGQITAMVVKFVNDHPEAWNKDAGILVMYALVPDFPCKKSQ